MIYLVDYGRQVLSLDFVFTDSHAYYSWANYFTNLQDLNRVDWGILQRRDFKRDPNDPAKFERYQAEALVHRHCPVSALEGIVCYTDTVKLQIENWLNPHNIQLPVYARSNWYFT
jgi:ssDNA thymidine ADP-ribosyltransferase, DarT